MNPLWNFRIERPCLNQGGSLFLSGQDIGWDLADPSGAQDSQYSASAAKFYRDDLNSIYRADISGSSKVIGIPGSIGQGLSFDIYQPKIAHHYQFPDWIEAAPDAQLIFKYDNERGGRIAFTGNYSVINLGFSFEAIDSKYDESPAHFSKTRTEFMRRVLDNLGPLRHQPIADSDVPIDMLSISVEISPLIDDLTSLLLFWKTENMPDYSKNEMLPAGENFFQQTIALNAYLGQVQYYFELETPFFKIFHPVSSPNKPYSIHIGADRVPPEIYHTPLPDIFIQNTGRLIEVFVEDNIAVDKKSVWLHYSSAATMDSLKMTPVESDFYQAFIPPIIKQGDSVRYYFTANDQALVANHAVSDIFSYQTGIEGFEPGLDFWIADSNGWQIDDKDFHSGSYCISTFPGKAYPNNQNVSIRSRLGVPRRDLQNAMLYLWTRYELEESKDFGFIEISSDHGENWLGIGEPVTGIEKNWIQKCYDLDIFYLESKDTLLLRFRLQTDSSQAQSLPGWFIDDIRIRPAKIVSAPENEPGSHPALAMLADFSNAPNPFNEVTRINFEINIPGDVELEIFNMIGQTVFRRSMGVLPVGRHATFWNGRDSNGTTCGSGLYFCRLVFKIDESKPSQKQLSRTIKIIYLQ